MRLMKLSTGTVFVLAIFLSSAVSNAQEGQGTLSGGYSHLYTGNHPGLFFDRDGGYVDADFAWRVPFSRSPLLLGFGLGGSGYFENQDLGFSFDNNSNRFDDGPTLFSDVGNFEIEPRLALDLRIPRTHLFIKPCIGAGLLINGYSIDQTFTQNNTTFIQTLNHTGAAIEIHPSLQAGITWGPAAVGLEAGYIASWGDFGSFGNRQQELRAGAFFTLKF